jgi:uncharacterized membrane protein (DUF2068 family)
LTKSVSARQLIAGMPNALELESLKNQTPVRAQHVAPAHDRDRGALLLIGLFKISKALGCVLLGVACLHLIHRDIGDLAMQIFNWLDIDSGGKLATLLLDKADLISGHQLRITGAMSFAGAVLYTIEGTGLLLRKVWAEYFTVVLTTLGIPWEVYEMIKHFTLWKAGLFAANLLVLVYLVWLLRRKRKKEHTAWAATQ